MSTQPKNDNSNPEWVKKVDTIILDAAHGAIPMKEAFNKLEELGMDQATAQWEINLYKGVSDEKNI